MAKTEFTFPEYINNPLGDATMAYREVYKKLYEDKLDNIIAKRHYERIKYSLYYTNQDTYYVHFKIPSESVEDLYYDTVIYFYPNRNVPNNKSLVNHFIKVFSNDPTFNFVYAYTFNKLGLIIPDLKSKLNDYALKNKAEKTTPKQNIGYIKSLYFSYILMRRYNIFNKVAFQMYGNKYNKNTLLKEIASYDEKTEEYNLRKEYQTNRNREVKVANSQLNKARALSKSFDNRNNMKSITNITKVPNVKKIDRSLDAVSKVSKNKKVSRIKKTR